MRISLPSLQIEVLPSLCLWLGAGRPKERLVSSKLLHFLLFAMCMRHRVVGCQTTVEKNGGSSHEVSPSSSTRGWRSSAKLGWREKFSAPKKLELEVERSRHVFEFRARFTFPRHDESGDEPPPLLLQLSLVATSYQPNMTKDTSALFTVRVFRRKEKKWQAGRRRAFGRGPKTARQSVDALTYWK